MPGNSPHIPDPAFAEEGSLTTHPAYLYILTFPDGVSVFTTSWEAAISVENLPARHGAADPQSFTPSQIAHGPAEKAADLSNSEVQLTASSDDPKLRLFFTTAAAVEIKVTIIRCNTEKLIGGGTIDYNTDCYPVTGGKIGSISMSGSNIIADVLPAPFGIADGVPRFVFQRTCNHSLGGDACGVNLEARRWDTQITLLDRPQRVIHLDGLQSGTTSGRHYQGGHLIHVPTGMMIGITAGSATSGNATVWLNYWNTSFAIDDAIKLYPGCDRTVSDCRGKYNNASQYGGFPYVPTKNPAIHGAQ